MLGNTSLSVQRSVCGRGAVLQARSADKSLAWGAERQRGTLGRYEEKSERRRRDSRYRWVERCSLTNGPDMYCRTSGA